MEPNTIQKHTNHCVRSMYIQFNGTTVVPAANKIPEFIRHTPLSENNFIKPALL